jgi:uncharacterized OB-fold protein
MSDTDRTLRPTGTPTAITAPFWDAARDHRLVIQHCRACDRLQHYPRAWCTKCLSEDLDWSEMSGNATIYAHTIVRKATNPMFTSRVPYVYAVVELDEGIRMSTNIVGVAVDDVRIGMPVRVVFEAAANDMVVPLFTPR